jgi:transcriptional regulator with XRE-family HTH domain
MKRASKLRPDRLRLERNRRGWTETEAARRLGMSQSYLAMLENGQRRVTPRLARKFKAAYGLSPTSLPTPELFEPGVDVTSESLAKHLSVLGYPGFAYLKSGQPDKNPAEVLANALTRESVESRVVEALPWLLLQFWDMDFDWLVREAKLNDLQNRLGFVNSLAKGVAERLGVQSEDRNRALGDLGKRLEGSRLTREDTFLKPVSTDAEREWLRQNRSEDAKHWNLLTNWRSEHLSYVL